MCYLFKTTAGKANIMSPLFSWHSSGKGDRATSSNNSSVIRHETSYLTVPLAGASNAWRDRISYTDASWASLWRHLTLYSASKRRIFKHGGTRSSLGLTMELMWIFPFLKRDSWSNFTRASSATSSSSALCHAGSESARIWTLFYLKLKRRYSTLGSNPPCVNTANCSADDFRNESSLVSMTRISNNFRILSSSKFACLLERCERTDAAKVSMINSSELFSNVPLG